MQFDILRLAGDGIGPEVTKAAVRVLDWVAARGGHTVRYARRLIEGRSIDEYGAALHADVLAEAQSEDAVLMDYPLKPKDVQREGIRGLNPDAVQSAPMTLAPALQVQVWAGATSWPQG